MHRIVVLGAGKSSFTLISYLAQNAGDFNYALVVADGNEMNLQEKKVSMPNIETYCGDLGNTDILKELISDSFLVVSLLPPFMHATVARLCLGFKKHLLTASYVSDEIQSLHQEAKEKGLAFIMECGLDPGIDHMSAMKIIDELKTAGARIHSFRSYCGGLTAPESDDNPWGYKITWNPKNVVTAGKGTAQYLEDGSVKYVPYHQIFKRTFPVIFDKYGEYETYPNRDSLHYMGTYDLPDVQTFVRGTIRKKGYCAAWNYIVQLGLTDDTVRFFSDGNLTKSGFVNKFLPADTDFESYLDLKNKDISFKLDWLGLNSREKLPLKGEVTPADCLQAIIEDKWRLKPGDKDLVLMQHIIDYTLNGNKFKLTSSLSVEGQNQAETAMAKTVGLPLGIATLLLYQKKIENKGVIIPVLKEIYYPVLEELHNNGLIFREYTYS